MTIDRVRRNAAAVVAAAIVALLAVSCAGSQHSDNGSATRPDRTASSSTSPPAAATSGASPSSPTSASPTASPLPAKPELCGKAPGAQAFWLPGPGKSRLEANSVGNGKTAVVFLHEVGRTGMCGFWEYATWLAKNYPVRAVLVNRCGYGLSTCEGAFDPAGIIRQTTPAVAWGRAHGATRVAIVGASAGGGDAIDVGAALGKQLSAVVALSPDGDDYSGSVDAAARKVTIPTLYAVAPGDPYASVEAVRKLYTLTPAATKKLQIMTKNPGDHGWDLLFDSDGNPRPLATEVADWVVGRTR